MIGNTNANASDGGSGNIGNESAVDLLIAQNEAKTNLANNLNGKGITANANTETLNELVQKVSDIVADSTAQFPESITLNATLNGSSLNSSFLKTHGYIFFIVNGSQIKNIKYMKISDIEGLATDNVSNNTTSIINSSGNSANNLSNSGTMGKPMIANSDCTKIYTLDISNNFISFTVTWNNNTITGITYDGILVSSFSSCGCISISSDDKYILMSGNPSSNPGIYLYDITNNTNTRIIVFSGTPSVNSIIKYCGNNQFVYGTLSSQIFTLEHYTLSGTTATLINTKNVGLLNSSFSFGNIDSRVKVVEYDTDKYKVIVPLEPYETKYDDYKLAIYDTDTKDLIGYKNSKIEGFENFSGSTASNNYAQYVDVKHDTNINRWLITSGCNIFIFDDEWNLINDVNVNTTDVISYGMLLFGENSRFLYIDTYSSGYPVWKIPYYYGKKTIMKKTVSIEGNSKDLYFANVGINTQDIEDGYYD